MDASSYLTTYQQYWQTRGLALGEMPGAAVAEWIAQTNWEEPQSPLDWNNGAVLALIEAEAATDPELRGMYLEMAIAALDEAIAHPLGAVHWALVQSLLGDRDQAIQAAFSELLTAVLRSSLSVSAPPGLIFVPQRWQGYVDVPYTQLQRILTCEDGQEQALLLAAEVLCQSQFVFYNPSGLRFLQLATQVLPDSPLLNLNLGIASLMGAQWEGLVYLHRAQRLQPQNPAILQALALAYKGLQQPEMVQHWQQVARQVGAVSDAADWTQVPLAQPFTYVPFQRSLPMAVESSFQSIVTGVLLAKGTWFEQEMEFWQATLQPGMTVIDVGANVGVYTFSAAQRVGATGRVLAIEPFSNCVQCLQETCRVNHLDWVTVCRGAASDRTGTAYLSLHAASELNELVTQPTAGAANVEEVPCFTLDSLLEQEHLQRVDVLKIDAEGHELQVLQGSDRLLQTHAPIILYENIAGAQGSNLPVAEYLVNKGYQLCRYQPFVQQLLPVQLDENLSGNLNIIALPIHKTSS